MNQKRTKLLTYNIIGLKRNTFVLTDIQKIIKCANGLATSSHLIVIEGFSTSSRGNYSAGHKQDGLWKYYHKNGKISSLETHSDSKLIDKQYFDEDGIQMNDTTNHDRPAKYWEKDEDWSNYLNRSIDFPYKQQIVNGNTATIIVEFTINEDGMVEDVYTNTTFSELFDREAENAIKQSPQWYAAISHNRKVKYRTNQVFKFSN